AGVVSIEDILEEIVGDIDDEYDVAREDPLVILEKGRLAEIDGKIKVDDLNEALGTDLPESEDYETVGGFVFSHLGRIPKSGDTFTYESTQFRILQAGPRNIERMKVQVQLEERAGT
ncbi:MAG: transporter associated domain-containing protein, partial [Planctomycetota bacterium]